MSRIVLGLLLLLPALTYAAPQVTPRVIARAELLNADKAVVGGTVALQIDVLVDTWFSSPPELPTLVLDGAVVAAPGGEALHLTEKQGGTSLFGLRYAYQITPQYAQEYQIPALTLRVTPGQGQGTVEVNTPALRFTAVQPAGVTGEEQVLVAQEVELTQKIGTSHEPLRVGDSLTRQVQIRAVGGQAMLIPAPDFASVKGLNRYVQPPTVHPLNDGRGGVSGGAREDAVIYRITEQGSFQLPAIELRWWSSVDQQMHMASVPEVTVEAQDGSGYRAPFSVAEDLRAIKHSAQVSTARHWFVLLAALLVGGVSVYFLWPWARSLMADWRQLHEQRRRAWLDSADYAWQLTRRQITSRPLRLDGLYLWVRRSSGHVDLGSFLVEHDTSFTKRLQHCLERVYGRSGSGPDAVPELGHALNDLHKVYRPSASPSPQTYSLKPLNPSSTKEVLHENARPASAR